MPAIAITDITSIMSIMPTTIRIDHGHSHGPGEVCDTCGHAHAPDPSMLKGDRFALREAWSAIIAVGLRPCSGALIVLSFALLNGLYLGGVLSVFAMSIGTAITVSCPRDTGRYREGPGLALRVQRIIGHAHQQRHRNFRRIAALLVLGVVLLGASLQG